MTAPRKDHGVNRDKIERSCTSKNRHPDVYTVVAIGITQSERSGVKLYYYLCEICEGWHLTKNRYSPAGKRHPQCKEQAFD